MSSNIQTQLDAKQPKVTNVSDTEIGYLDGVTSAIQTQLNNKLSNTNAIVNDSITINKTSALDDLGLIINNSSSKWEHIYKVNINKCWFINPV